MVMEHFEMHKENLEDLIIDLHKQGPKILVDVPEEVNENVITINDFALIDEISGLNLYLDNFVLQHDMPETVRNRSQAKILRY